MPRHLWPLAIVFALIAAPAAGLSAGQAGAAGSGRAAPRGVGVQPLLLLERTVVARARPRPGARAVAVVGARTVVMGTQVTLPVLRSWRGPAGRMWLKVRLPARPNGSTGWVPADAGSPAQTNWGIVVHRAAHVALILRGGKVRARFSVVVGAPATPTPLGTFFVVEKLRLVPGLPEGPWALTTSAYSHVIKQFAGGPGQIALHGVPGFGAPLGTSGSHGCVRFANSAITWIATHVEDGTPVVIQP